MSFLDPKGKEGTCPVCGKAVVIRSVRDNRVNFCSRVCASNRTYIANRYRGSISGPMDRPQDTFSKTRWEA